MQRTALINGKTKNFDVDYGLLTKNIITPGVIEGLEVTGNSVSSGKAFIKVVRTSITPNQEFYIAFNNTTAVTIDTSGTKKVFISLPKININDSAYNPVDGLDIATIQTASEYPTEDFIPLASITSGVITDERLFIKISPEIAKAGNVMPMCTLLTIYEDYEFTGEEKNNTGFSCVTTDGQITVTLDLSLFPSTYGMHEFKFCKSTTDVNKVIIDVGVGNTIDGSQTYELQSYMETVVIAIVNNSFAKVISNPGKTTPIDIGSQSEVLNVIGSDEFILNRVGEGNKKVKSQNLFLYNSALSGIVGETISKGNGLCIPSIIGEGTIIQNTHSNIYGWVYGDSYGQTAVVPVGVKIKTITGYIQSTGNAIALRCEIFTGVGGTSLGYVDVGIESNSPAGDKTFTFSSPITATTSTIYIKFTKIAGTGASGPYTATNNPYANGSFYFNDVIVNNNDLRFSIIYDIANTENKLYKTDVTKTDRRVCIGIAENDALIDEEVIYTEKGLSKSLTGFSKGDNLYLHNSTPGLLSTTINTYGLIGVMVQETLFDVGGTPKTNNSIGNISSSFAFGTNYLAPTSGFVVGYVWTSSAVNRASCYVGDTSPAGTLVLKSGGDYYSGYGGFCFPVKKGQYWRVDVSNGSITESKVSFIPNI